jgi:hypothetical protein
MAFQENEMNTTSKQPTARPVDVQIQRMVERLYKDETLTDSLDDKGAKVLLDWGEQFFARLNRNSLTNKQIENVAQDVLSIMRSINRIAEKRLDMSDGEFVKQMIAMINNALTINKSVE